MPPRIQNVNAAGTGVGAWFESLPPITRTYAASLFIVTLLWRLGFVNVMWIALLWPRVATHFEVRAALSCNRARCLVELGGLRGVAG